uniref:Cyclic AMP response element binging protein n=1 Tax=Sinohyriopsis cumingii TaxID=165450 RepID=A0A8G0QBJ6_SINCU|nr:cyclic AMP response element binging protein [Sinohyriopsis cumingii]
MEFYNYLDAPCLLDELMDKDLITCDVDLGVREVADCDRIMTKDSPSHTSDSGISDIRSVSPTSSMSDYEPEFFDLEPFGGDLISATLASDVSNMNENSDGAVHELLSTHINSDEAVSSDVDVDETYEDDELFPTRRNVSWSSSANTVFQGSNVYNKTTRVTLPSLSKNFVSDTDKMEEIRILNKKELLRTPKIHTVKVVKVIKTPADASKSETDMRVLEAIEDRNKKNAFQAKVNRERKKAYITGLEEEVKSLKTENAALRDRSKKILAEKSALEEEVDYLKSVLANQSALAGLLKNIGNVKNINLKTSFMHQKRSAEHDHSYENAKRLCAAQQTAGVCLHVDKEDVSLEFCAQCARSAKITSRKNS